MCRRFPNIGSQRKNNYKHNTHYCPEVSEKVGGIDAEMLFDIGYKLICIYFTWFDSHHELLNKYPVTLINILALITKNGQCTQNIKQLILLPITFKHYSTGTISCCTKTFQKHHLRCRSQ